MTAKVTVNPGLAQIAALRAKVRKLRREAARKLCPNPIQTLRVAQLLHDIADSIEALMLAHVPRPVTIN